MYKKSLYVHTYIANGHSCSARGEVTRFHCLPLYARIVSAYASSSIELRITYDFMLKLTSTKLKGG